VLAKVVAPDGLTVLRDRPAAGGREPCQRDIHPAAEREAVADKKDPSVVGKERGHTGLPFCCGGGLTGDWFA
jgi:hypothetical protein